MYCLLTRQFMGTHQSRIQGVGLFLSLGVVFGNLFSPRVVRHFLDKQLCQHLLPTRSSEFWGNRVVETEVRGAVS
jgi:hypothetical protein